MAASAPPLRIWLCSAALATGVVALLGLNYWSRGHTRDMAVAMHTQQFLDARPEQNNLRVLALGSSLLWASMPPQDSPATPGVNWMRMSKPGAGIGYLAPSLDVIDRVPPDVLVIEENLLLAAQDSVAMETIRTDFFLATKKLAYRLTGQQWIASGQRHEALLDQGASFQCDAIAPQLQPQEIAQRGTHMKRFFRHAPVDQELLERLQHLSRRGVHLVVLELRRSEAVEQAIALEKKEWQWRLRQALPASPHVHYIATPAFTQANLYCDGSHMNHQGAQLFSTWWQAQLQQWRKEI